MLVYLFLTVRISYIHSTIKFCYTNHWSCNVDIRSRSPPQCNAFL